MSYRDEILAGAKEATRLHERLGIREHVEKNGGQIDVFGTALRLEAMVLFKELKGILGAFLREDNATGIIVTTQRRLAVQRFTGAHEIGHLVMGHEPSIDDEEVIEGKADDPVEIQANGFAAEFMAPRWLLVHHAKRQGWTSESMRTPAGAYQLSLRLGLSYEATCRSLTNHKIITGAESQQLLGVQRKEIKQSLLPGGYEPPNWYGDIWLITEQDRGARIEGHPDDLFVLKLWEKSTAGYLWDVAALKDEGFDIYTDEGVTVDREAVGGDRVREITAGNTKQSAGTLNLRQRRAWQPENPVAELTLAYELWGKELGLPRAQRPKLEAAH